MHTPSGDRAGRTPLFLAVSSGSEDVVELLLNSGANITLKNKYKETPLHCCARSLSCLLCQVLCDDQGDFVPFVQALFKKVPYDARSLLFSCYFLFEDR